MKFLTVLFLLFFSSVNAQNVKYIDEDMNSIDSITLYKKCNQLIFKCLKYDTDTLVINKVLQRFKFGTLSPSNFENIKNELSNDSGRNIGSDEFIIVRYYDSLKSFSKVNKVHQNHPKKRQKIYFDSSKTRYYYRMPHKFNQRIFEKNRNKFIKYRNKCVKKYENKFNSLVFHVYDDDSGIAHEYENFDWIEDNGLFKETFFNIIYNYSSVVIKPDGEYFLIGGHISDKNVYQLLSNRNWETFKLQLNETKESYIINGIGIFENESNSAHIKHCF